jgi:serine protease SohB
VSDFFSAYGLFLLELLTVAGIIAAVVFVVASARRTAAPDGISVKHLNREFESRANVLKRAVLGRRAFRKEQRRRHKQSKQEQRAQERGEKKRSRVFVIDFKGDIRASATASLREEVSAILAVAADGDRVLVRLENAGGAVHDHGLAASQLLRVTQRGIELVAAVDKVAASGGYLMACVADRIVAAPFAIIGSIGVLAQLPNFHRLLEQNGIDFEQITAGRYKRTLTLFGKNTEEGRQKMREELEEVHALFKRQIAEYRPQVPIDDVATGEHWYGSMALERGLVDEIATSDDFLLEAAKERDLYHVSYKRRRRLQERLLGGAESLLSRN